MSSVPNSDPKLNATELAFLSLQREVDALKAENADLRAENAGFRDLAESRGQDAATYREMLSVALDALRNGKPAGFPKGLGCEALETARRRAAA